MESFCLRSSVETVKRGNKAFEFRVNLILWLGNKTEEYTINKTTVIISYSDVIVVNLDTTTCHTFC